MLPMSETNRTQITGRVDDPLRTRIASALLGDHCVQGMTAPCDDCRAYALRQADAVIRELELEREHWQYGDGDTMGVRYRYVTHWEESNE